MFSNVICHTRRVITSSTTSLSRTYSSTLRTGRMGDVSTLIFFISAALVMTDTYPVFAVGCLFELGVLLSKWLAVAILIDLSMLIIDDFIIIIPKWHSVTKKWDFNMGCIIINGGVHSRKSLTFYSATIFNDEEVMSRSESLKNNQSQITIKANICFCLPIYWYFQACYMDVAIHQSNQCNFMIW